MFTKYQNVRLASLFFFKRNINDTSAEIRTFKTSEKWILLRFKLNILINCSLLEQQIRTHSFFHSYRSIIQ